MDHLAIALHNAQTYEQERRRAAEESARRMVLAAASQKEELREILDAILAELIEATHTHAAWLFLQLDEDQAPTLAAHAGLSRAFVREEAEAAATCTVCSASMKDRTAILVDLAEGCPHLSGELLRSEQLTKHLAAPVLDRGRVVGVLNVATKSEHSTLASQREMLETIRREIGPVVMQAVLHQRVCQEQLKLSTIQRQTAPEAEGGRGCNRTNALPRHRRS